MGTAIIIPKISFADSDMGKVTISTERPLEELAIYGPDTVHGGTDQAQYYIKYFPAGTTERGIVWSIDSGSEYATINASTGVLTVLNGADEDTVVIKATSSENPSICAYKSVTVSSYIIHTIIPLSYIAADGLRYVDTGIDAAADLVVKADFKIANITINNTTDRQFAYSDTNNVSTSYSLKWNSFAINYTGALKSYTLASFYDRGLSTSSPSGSTLLNKTTGQTVSLNQTGGQVTGNFGRLYLFSGRNASHTYKKVSVYGFEVVRGATQLVNLSPVLYDGVPCYYDSVSDSYIPISGESGSIWYATAEAPDTEIQYA